MIPKSVRRVDEALLIAVRQMPCVICLKRPADAHHIRSKGAGGPDAQWNVTALCRVHHQRFHALGIRKFCEESGIFSFWLLSRGWRFIDEKWSHPELEFVDDAGTTK